MIDSKNTVRANELLQFMLTDTNLMERMAASDALSKAEGQVAHGWAHAQDVYNLTKQVAERTEALFPGTFSDFHMVCALTGALLHDTGRAVAIKDHDKHGARISHEYLRELGQRLHGDPKACPADFRKRVVALVRKHRSDSWLYSSPEEKALRKREIDGPDIAALLIADKLCGSESRVPEAKLSFLSLTAELDISPELKTKHGLDANWRLSRINWGNPELISEPQEVIDAAKAVLAAKGLSVAPDLEIDGHDRVNGSIKDRVIELMAYNPPSTGRFKGTMIYRIRVDERLAPQELVTGLDWWGEAFHTVAKAAKYLGFRFMIQFNDRTLQYSRRQAAWISSTSMSAN
ncbi:MAG: HD domain-containing protein [Candidatus Obscuribacterales bacterium]|nr:HD domain-containing protein [Candidatus Obscuribacterales bacterium]